MKLVCVPPDRAKDAWQYAHDFIDAAMKRSGLGDVSEVRNDVLSGFALLWLVADDKVRGAVVTKLIGPVCEITAFGGTKDQLPLIDGIEKFARAEGCKALRILGPEGWARLLPGFETKATIMERPL